MNKKPKRKERKRDVFLVVGDPLLKWLEQHPTAQRTGKVQQAIYELLWQAHQQSQQQAALPAVS